MDDVLYRLLVEIKGDVGEIKGTIRAVAEAGDIRERKLLGHEARLEALEDNHRELSAAAEAVKAFKGQMIALASGIAGVVAFLVNVFPAIWKHFS